MINVTLNFLIKQKNETKNFTIECYNVLGGMNKVMQSSAGFLKFISAIELIIIIPGRIYKNVVNACLKCDNVPVLRKKYTVKIANDRKCVTSRFIQDCRERHFHNFK